MANGEGTYNSTRCVPPPPEVDGEVFDLSTTSGFMGWKTRDKLIEKRINIVKERVIGSSSTIKHCWYNMLTIHLRAMQEQNKLELYESRSHDAIPTQCRNSILTVPKTAPVATTRYLIRTES